MISAKRCLSRIQIALSMRILMSDLPFRSPQKSGVMASRQYPFADENSAPIVRYGVVPAPDGGPMSIER
jgi:hypothetical protein